MWLPGTPVVITVSNTPQLLIPTPVGLNLVKSIRIMPDPANSGIIYWGLNGNGITMSTTSNPKTGILGWVPPPGSPPINYSDTATEVDAPNGINAAVIWVAGTANDVVLWSYILQ